jgi:hypothetical protein
VSQAAAIARGVAFVEAGGERFSIARACALAAGRTPEDFCLPDGATQRSDGSIGSVGAEAGSALEFESELMLRVLGAAADLRGLHLPVVERACSYLEAVQTDDGSWGTLDESEERKIIRTGMLAGHLGKTRFARAAMLGAAGDYIADRFTPDLVQNFNWPAIAAYANYFANVPHEESDAVLQWVGRELERGFRSGRFDGVQTARVLLYAEAPSLPGGRVDAAEALERLLAEQQADGGWLRFDDPAASARLDHTLDALTALVRLG